MDFRVTYHCNLRCEHCFVEAGPQRRKHRLSDEFVFGVVGDMPAADMSTILLGAGEPFLYLPTIIEVIKRARAQGIPRVQLVSNGYWAKTLDRARKVIGQLAEAGYSPVNYEDGLKVSTGVFHVKAGIPLQTVANAVIAHYEAFKVPLKVGCEEIREEVRGNFPPMECSDSRVVEAGLLELGAPLEGFEFAVRSFVPVGSGKEIAEYCRYEPPETVPRCTSLNKLAIEPDGRVMPCCGANTGNTGILIPGTLKTHSLDELNKLVANNPLLQFIERNPLGRLFPHLGRKPDPKGYAGKCHLCDVLLGGLEGEELARVQNHFQQYADFYPHMLTRPFGDNPPAPSEGRTRAGSIE